jgi:hypothetical protein
MSPFNINVLFSLDRRSRRPANSFANKQDDARRESMGQAGTREQETLTKLRATAIPGTAWHDGD